MKILIINTSDINGGAAIAARRLFYALQSEGYNVSMAVRSKFDSDVGIFRVGSSKGNTIRFFWERGIIFLILSPINLYN